MHSCLDAVVATAVNQAVQWIRVHPTPTSPRQIQSSGTQVFSFGGGARRGAPGADDEEYQEYLLWKEWQTVFEISAVAQGSKQITVRVIRKPVTDLIFC